MRSIRPFARLAAPVAMLGVLAALTLSAAPVQAQSATFAGTLVLTDPVFNRPLTTTSLSGVGTAVHYNTQAFFVSTSGNYDLLLTATGFDPFLAIYQTSFNPASPLTNVVAVNDDLAGSLTQSGFASQALTANTQYFFVTTAFSNTGVGTYVNSIGTVTRPTGSAVTLGTISGAAAPEPGSLALAGMGSLPLIGLVARRRKNRA